MAAEVRCKGIALASNLVEGWFGGTTPLSAAMLIARASGNPIYLGVYLETIRKRPRRAFTSCGTDDGGRRTGWCT